jgi:hypothetical protein
LGLNNIYLEKILKEIPRILGLLDKNITSPTFGCFDRNFWHYNISDFPCARFQEAVLTLSLLYSLDFPNNIYFQNNIILSYINAGINFWCKIQKRDGSFDEWYPNEHSFVATAFSSYAISEALLLLKEKIKDKEKILEHLSHAGDFLIKNEDFTAVNQIAGSIIALYNIYLLTSEEKYNQGAKTKLEKLRNIQKEEGWFPEYGGPDIGYLSLLIDYLAKYHKKTKNERAKKIIEKALDFLVYFSHPDLSFGGEYGSRNTKYIIPSGIEYSAHFSKSARMILTTLRKALSSDLSIGPYNLDDRYLAYIGYTYIQAYYDFYHGDLESPIYEREFYKYFPESGIIVKSNKNFYVIGNLRKGGTLKIDFKKNNRSLRDSGPVICIKNKIYAPSLDSYSHIHVNEKFETENKLSKISFTKMTPFKNLIFKLFQITFGRNKFIGFWVKKILRDLLIPYKKRGKILAIRKIYVEEDKIVLEDEIFSKNKIDRIILGIENPYIFIPSSRYFQIQELNTYMHLIDINKDHVKIRREYNVEGEEKLIY